MRRVVCPFALVLLGHLCSLAYAAGNQTEPPADKLLQIRVRTVDTLGNPIARAHIQAWQSGGEGRRWWMTKRLSPSGETEVRTNKDGWAMLSLSLAPDPATYIGPRIGFCLTAQAPKYLATRVGRIDPAAHDHFEITITLRRLAPVEGRVVDQQGRPVVEATVFHTGNAAPGTVPIFAAGRDKNGTVPLYATEVKTDAQGRFRIDGLPEGKSPIFATHPRYHFHGQLVDASVNSPPQELKLLAVDQTPPPRRTLPPLRSHEEEMKLARQVIRPLWESAVQSGPEEEKELNCEAYARIEPWVAYDYVHAHLSKQSMNRFMAWQTPQLYAADPDEALAVLESLDMSEDMKAFALLGTVRTKPGSSVQQKLDLLDRATQHLRATTDPDDRVMRLSSVALRLFKLGKTEEAKQIVAFLTPTAKQLSPKDNVAACTTAGEAISLFDLPAGVQFIRTARSEEDRGYPMCALFHVAYRIAKQQPAEAERLAEEALDVAGRSYRKYYQKTYQCEPTEEDMADIVTSYESRLTPLCYDLASVDAARAERIAAAIHNPNLRAYALGMVAKALAPVDKAKARKLVVQAYDILTASSRNPDRRWPQDYWTNSLPTIAGALLPVVEDIDATLVGECMWRAVSFRLHRPADDFIVKLEPEGSDISLAGSVARYDRELARAFLGKAQAIVLPSPSISALSSLSSYSRLPALAAMDAKEALEVLRANATSSGAEAGKYFADAMFLFRILPIESAHRWDFLASQYYLWIPDNQYDADSNNWW